MQRAPVVRAFVAAALVLACHRPAWIVRSADGIPRDAAIWIVPAAGGDEETRRGFDERIVGLVVHDGARVRQDAAWTVSVRLSEVTRCRNEWGAPGSARAVAILTIRYETVVTDMVELHPGIDCKYSTPAKSGRHLGEHLARRVADLVAWRRHDWY